MHRQQQLALDSLRRVQAYTDIHADVLGALKDTEARKQLDGAVDAALAQVNVQGAAERALAGSATTVKQLVGDLKLNHMGPIAKFARANLRGVPDFNALTDVPHGLVGHSLVLAARAMATAGAPYVAVLTKAQFPADSVQQLGAAADALNTALDARVASESRRVEATTGIRQELALGREAVAMLEPIVTKKLVGQKGLLAAWRTAKRVKLMPTVTAVPTVVPTPVQVATPAAAPQVPSSSGTAQTAPAQEVKVA
jgi:hypothetical protein